MSVALVFASSLVLPRLNGVAIQSSKRLFVSQDLSDDTEKLIAFVIYSGRSNISSNYTVVDSSNVSPTHAGLWKIQRALRNSGGGGLSAAIGRPSTPSTSRAQSPSGASLNSHDTENSVGASTNSEKAIISIWTHTVGTRGRDRELVVETLKKEVSMRNTKSISANFSLTGSYSGINSYSTSTPMHIGSS